MRSFLTSVCVCTRATQEISYEFRNIPLGFSKFRFFAILCSFLIENLEKNVGALFA